MSAHVFHEIYLHFNWHVKDNHPTLRGDIETQVHDLIAARCRRTKGVFVHGINGTETHVHLAVNIEPFVVISDLVKDLKGGSAHELNAARNEKLLQWQRGYGVVSFGKNNLLWVLEYIARQKEHHAAGGVHDRLERIVADKEADE